MSDAGIRWLLGELPGLVRLGVLSEETAERLRTHYGEPRTPLGGARLALIVFGSLGAALIGGGVVLLLAHNWENLSRPLRAAISIAILLTAQALAGWVIARRRGSAAWCEASGGLLVIAAAASIALISQTYNLGGDLPDYLFTCAWLALPVLYLLDSRLAALIYWIGITVWVGAAGVEDRAGGWYWIFAAAGAPFLWMLARRPDKEWRLLGFAVIVSLTIGGGVNLAGAGPGGLWILYYGGLLASFLLPGAIRKPTPSWAGPFELVGMAGVPVLALVLTFRFPWEHLEIPDSRPLGEPAVLAALGLGLAAGLAALAFSFTLARKGRWHLALPAAALLPAAIGYAFSLGGSPVIPMVIFNLYLLGIGLVTLVVGFRAASMTETNFGLLLVAALATARFFDADISFVARGVGFILVGAGFLAVNLILMRRRKEMAA